MAYLAALITLAGVLAIFAVALYIAMATTPSREKEDVLPGVYRARLGYFITLVAVLVVALGLTLSWLPYPVAASAQKPDATVAVTGQMWFWRFEPVSGEDVRLEDSTLILPVGKLIEFQVTATDVNHGFGIYDDSGTVVTQTQAMPDYVNRLRYRFEQTGIYHVLCLEYCGLAHHNMITTIRVE